MRVRVALPMVAVVCLVPGLYFLIPRKAETEGVGDFETWTPTPKEIAREVRIGVGGRFDDERHARFTRLLQERFRQHEHAIGMKFLDDHTLKAMFAPTIPKWDMARVAVQAQKEASTVFGHKMDVDIYET